MFQVYRIETGRIFTVYSTVVINEDVKFIMFCGGDWVVGSAFLYKPVVEDERRYIDGKVYQ